MAENIPGGPGPEDQLRGSESTAEDFFTFREAQRGRELTGMYAARTAATELLGSLETLPRIEDILPAARYATEMAVIGDRMRVLEFGKGYESPHPYTMMNLEDDLVSRWDLLNKQLDRPVNFPGLNGQIMQGIRVGQILGIKDRIPARAETQVLDQEGHPVPRRVREVEEMRQYPIGVFLPDGTFKQATKKNDDGVEEPWFDYKREKRTIEVDSKDSDARIMRDRDGRPIFKTEPASNERLAAAAEATFENLLWVEAMRFFLRDSTQERKNANDWERLVRSFGAYWKDNPFMMTFATILRRKEIITGGLPDSILLDRGMRAWDKVVGEADPSGVTFKKPGGEKRVEDRVQNIFFQPPTESQEDTAVRAVMAAMSGQDISEFPPLRQAALAGDAYWHLRFNARLSLEMYRFFRLDVEHSIVEDRDSKTGMVKLVTPGSAMDRMFRIQPGVPIYRIEAGRITSSDLIKIMFAPVRVVNEVNKSDYPYSVGAARAVGSVLPMLTLDKLSLVAVYREKEGTDQQQRISFRRLMEAGVSYADLPWEEGEWGWGEEYLNKVFGVNAEEAKDWSLPQGARLDADEIPVGLQTFYSAGYGWSDVTGSVKDFVEKMTDPASLNKENKPISIGTVILCSELGIDRSTAIKLGQFIKVTKMGALGIMAGLNSNLYDAGIRAPLQADPKYAGTPYKEVSKSRLNPGSTGFFLRAARKQAQYLSHHGITWTVAGGSKKSADQLENDLFVKIVENGGGVTIKETGWFSDEELIQLARIFPYGVGYTQGEMADLAKKGVIKTAEQLRRLRFTDTLVTRSTMGNGEIVERRTEILTEEDYGIMKKNGWSDGELAKARAIHEIYS